MPVAYVGAAATAASAINGIVGGGPDPNSSYGGNPGAYIPMYQPNADQRYFDLTTQMKNYAPTIPDYVVPIAGALTNNLENNPYAPGYMGAANTAGQYAGGTLAPMQQAGAASLNSLGQGAGGYANDVLASARASVPMANQILQTGFDPQSALYNRTQQQVQDQVNAINSMYGLNNSPYGAGVANKTLSDFNIDWQNQQLGRQNQAAQGYSALLNAGVAPYSNLVNTAGKGFAGASDLGGASVQSTLQGGSIPYSSYSGINTDALSALGSYSNTATQAFGLDQNTLNALAAYMKLGQSATSIGQAGQAQGFDQSQTLGQGFGQALSSLNGTGLQKWLSNQVGSIFGGPSNVPMDGISGGYTNVNPNTFNYYTQGGEYLAA